MIEKDAAFAGRPRTGARAVLFVLPVFGIVLALALMELAARLIFPQPGSIAFIPDEVTGFRHQPSQRVWLSDEAGEFEGWFRTNSHGDPDPERSLGKPQGGYRVAVLGDSMVEAAQVPPEQRFTRLLEQALASAGGTDDRLEQPVQTVEVLNFGVSGFGTAQEWLYYREHVRNFDPDLVLLFFLPGNDIKNNSFELEVRRSCRPEVSPFYRLDADRGLALQNERFFPAVLARYRQADESLADRIRLVSLARRAAAAVRSGSLTTGRVAQLDQDACQTETTLELFDPEMQAGDPAWQEAWQVTGALLQQLAADVAQDGAEFQVVTLTGPWEVQPETRSLVLPEAEQAGYDWELPHRMADELITQLGLEYHSLLPAMNRAVQEDGLQVHFLYNGHYTPAGHQVIARELLPRLVDALPR